VFGHASARTVIIIQPLSETHVVGRTELFSDFLKSCCGFSFGTGGSKVREPAGLGIRQIQNKKQKDKIMESSASKLSQSGRPHVSFACILAVLLAACITTELRAQIVVVPNAFATNSGNSPSTSPTGNTSTRWLQIYDASQFTNALSGPSLLTQFAYRPGMTPGASGPRTWILRVHASTTSRSVAGISATFDDNIGTNNTLVFDGTVNLTTGNLPGPGNTRQFDMVFPFTTPFLYDPAAGNLVLSLQFEASGSAITLDRVTGNPTVGQVINTGSSTAPTAVGSGVPHPTQFTFEPPPPPLVTIRTSQVEICWNGKSNLTYQVQYRSNLTTNQWTALGNCVQGSGSVNCLTDPIAPGQPQRFYRVLLTNCVP
jgi:hypothetical protein